MDAVGTSQTVAFTDGLATTGILLGCVLQRPPEPSRIIGTLGARGSGPEPTIYLQSVRSDNTNTPW